MDYSKQINEQNVNWEESLLSHALTYAKKYGWKVIPLHTPIFDEENRPATKCSCGKEHKQKDIGKHPRFDIDILPNGLTNASDDAETIKRWWAKWPDANIGIITGKISNLVVVDVDGPNGKRSVMSAPDLPMTLCAQSGAGLHYYYSYPDTEEKVKTTVGVLANVDSRADGGYVCFTKGHKVIIKGKGEISYKCKKTGEIKYTNKGGNRLIDISKVKKDDTLIAYDEDTGKAVETIIQETSSRKVKETYIVKFGNRNGHIRLTAEHPLFTTKGWKQTKDLKIGDELFHVDNSFVGIDTTKGYRASKGTQPQKGCVYTKEKPYKQKVPNHSFRISNYEKFITALGKELNIPLKFVGSGELIISQDGHFLHPDFIIEGTNKIVEVSTERYKIIKENPNRLADMSTEQRLELYKKAGYEVLYIDASEWRGYDENTLSIIDKTRKQLIEFFGNGLKIEFISKIVEEVEVYNLHCEPFNNYFIHRINKGSVAILAHNCAPPSLHYLGHRYEWLDFVNLAAPPQWWLESLKKDPVTQDIGQAIKYEIQIQDNPKLGYYGRIALQNELARLWSCPIGDGKRNKTLYSASCAIYQLVGAGCIEDSFSMECLTEVALEKMQMNKSEALKTINSARKWGLQNPRNLDKVSLAR